MKHTITAISICVFSFSSGFVFAKQVEKKKDTSIESRVVADGYFWSADCDRYLDGLKASEQDTLRESISPIEVDETITYVAGGESIINTFEELFKNTKYSINPELKKTKDELEGKPYLRHDYSDEKYSSKTAEAAVSSVLKITKNQPKGSELFKNTFRYMDCRIAAAAIGMGSNANDFHQYADFVKSKVTKSQIGHFEVSADKGTYGPTVGTGNKYAEPKTWAGSRFFIVHASFKNLDTESRLPVEGSLFINYNGKDYEFDSIEPITLEGYNIWFRKINPLVTIKTKIVYRIPDEIHGEVYWRPGRNSGDTKLWVGFLPAAK